MKSITYLLLHPRNLWLAFILLCMEGRAQTSHTTINYLGIEQGLSNNAVRTIYKDSKGYMWFGTYDGLTRYDGHHCKVFRNQFDDSSSLIHNWIYCISEDGNNNLWIGTRQGMSVYNSIADRFSPVWFTSFQDTVNKQITSVVKDVKRDATGNMYVATQGNGLLFFDGNNMVGRQIPFEGTSETGYEVQALKITADKRVWLFVQGKGLCEFDPAKQNVRLVNNVTNAAFCLEATVDTVWIGTGKGVFVYDIRTGVCNPVMNKANGKLSDDIVLGLTIDSNKDLWIATVGGGLNILRRSSGKTDVLSEGNGSNELTSNAVCTVVEDEAGRKWIGTMRGGVNMIDPLKEQFITIARDPFHPANTLTSNFIFSLYEDKTGSILIGTDGGGLSVWDRAARIFTNYRHETNKPGSISDNAITAIRSDGDNNIWLGTFAGGMNLFNKQAGTFKKYACVNPVNGMENKVVYAVCVDRQDNLWVSTLRTGGINGALYKFDKLQDRFEAFDTNLSDVLTLAEDKLGNLWAGNFTQLIKIDRRTKQHHVYEIGKAVRSIFEDVHHNFWLGTEGGGLILFDRSKGEISQRYTTANGLCNNAVLTILEDPAGNLWMSTFNGIAAFNTQDHTFKNYYQEDGLQSNQFLYSASLALRSGELVFGGIKGFNIFNPSAITPHNNKTHVLLTDIKVDNVFLQRQKSITVINNGKEWLSVEVPFNKSAFAFNFTAPEYSAPGKIAYAYYMDGWDKDWNYSGNNSTAVYTHLSEGTYTFRIKCTNAEGVWNKEETTLAVIVLPPWYRSWWAYTLYALLAAGAVYTYMAYKSRQTRLRYAVTIANLNAQREKAERETERVLNEKKLSFFTNVSHEFRTPLTLIINPIKELLTNSSHPDTKELNVVYRNARRLLSLVDQLLLFRKADSEVDTLKLVRLNFSHICQEVYLCFAHQAKIKHIDYQFECANESMELFADREKIEIVLFNLLSNALKFTPQGGSIVFSVKETEETVQLSVIDSGCGIPEQARGKLFTRFYRVKESTASSGTGFGIGLYLVKHFIENHHGTIAYTSEEGKGTTFSVTLLKGKTHFGEEPVFQDVTEGSIFLQELCHDSIPEKAAVDLAVLVTAQKTVLVVDDDAELRKYIAGLFADEFTILEADNGEDGIRIAEHYLPDIIISDITMQGINGIELCGRIKNNPRLSHIPVVLLTASTASEHQLKGIESGADDYITKPFEKELLKARVLGMLKKRNALQQYFYNEITLKKNELKVSVEYKEFLEKCIAVVENHLGDDNFSIKTLVAEMGMSHSSLYKKVKSVSGQSINGFIRFIRLRRAAELMINTEHNINEIAGSVGFNNIKYFRQHFNELFAMNPSEYIRKYRKPFHNSHQINPKMVRD